MRPLPPLPPPDMQPVLYLLGSRWHTILYHAAIGTPFVLIVATGMSWALLHPLPWYHWVWLLAMLAFGFWFGCECVWVAWQYERRQIRDLIQQQQQRQAAEKSIRAFRVYGADAN